MPKRIPKYSHHKPTGQARVRINGKSFYLGPYDSEQSRQRYDALIANYLTGTLDADRETLTIGRLAVPFMDHARKVKKLSRTQNAVKHSVSRRQMIASSRLNFIRRHRILANFGAEYVLCPPAMAHPAGLSLRPREPAPATDHQIP